MKRREFITLLGGAAASTAPLLGARTQEAGRVYRLGVLHPFPDQRRSSRRCLMGCATRFPRRAKSCGRRSRIRHQARQYQEVAAEIVNSGVDALFCGGDEAIRAAQQVTRTIPIAGVADDMVGQGWWLRWRVPAATRPASASFRPSLMASVKSFSSNLCPARAGWRRFLTLAPNRPRDFRRWWMRRARGGLKSPPIA